MDVMYNQVSISQEEQQDQTCPSPRSLSAASIILTWSISESPGKSGLLVTISAKMQPRLQVSTEAV